jgi:multidrug transporter EmrE-like cation transporter
MAAMTQFDISHAYPFMSLNFVLVLILSWLLFHEPLTGPKIAGMALIVAGIIVGSRG